MPQTWSKADHGPNVFKRVNTTTTGTTAAGIWQPTTGTRYVLMGWSLVLTVDTVLAAAAAVNLVFVDNALATQGGPGLAGFAATAAAGTSVMAFGWVAGPGFPSGAINRTLKVEATADLSTGVIRVSGAVWGRETAG
jgi:nitrogen fixation protein FixH